MLFARYAVIMMGRKVNSLKRILEIIKNMAMRLLRRKQYKAPKHNLELENKIAKDIQERGKFVDTRRFGPNMPRRQHCSSCHKGAKRIAKTTHGAYYHCSKCGEFFVRAPAL